MWKEIAKKDKFLQSLYYEIPCLNNILIYDFNINRLYNDINIRFSLPLFADKPPKKWVQNEFNTVMIELKFCVIKDLEIKCDGGVNTFCNIDIQEETDGLYMINLSGDIVSNFKAEECMVLRANGYCDGRLV